MSQQINLFNPVFLVQQKYFSLLMIVRALGLILICSALFYAYAVYQVSEMSRQSGIDRKRFEAEEVILAQQSAEFSPKQSNQLLQDEIKQLENKLAEAKKLSDTLRSGAAGNSTGYSEYMRAFARQMIPGLWLTKFKLEGGATNISLSGGVLTPELVPAYIQNLRREHVMQGKSFAALQIKLIEGNNSGKLTIEPYVSFTLQSTPGIEVIK